MYPSCASQINWSLHQETSLAFLFLLFSFPCLFPDRTVTGVDLWGNWVPLLEWVELHPFYQSSTRSWSLLLTGCCWAFTFYCRSETLVFLLFFFFASPFLSCWDFPCKCSGGTPGTWEQCKIVQRLRFLVLRLRHLFYAGYLGWLVCWKAQLHLFLCRETGQWVLLGPLLAALQEAASEGWNISSPDVPEGNS